MKELVDLQISINSKNEHKTYIFEFANLLTKIINPFFNCFVCNSPCQAGIRIACLNVDGLLEKCDCVLGTKENEIGMYQKGNLASLLKTSKENNNSICHNDIPKCRVCEINKYCTYGCMAENVIFYGNSKRNEPGKLCLYYKKMIPFLLSKIEDGIPLEYFVG